MSAAAGTPWRILVHDQPAAVSYHVGDDNRNGSLPTSPEPQDTEHSKHIELAGTEFDELVVGTWIHVEQTDVGSWWMNIGGVTVWVRADPKGKPRSVAVYGPDDYAQRVKGCTYKLLWDGEER